MPKSIFFSTIKKNYYLYNKNGENMKKNIIICLSFVLLGLIIGRIIFSNISVLNINNNKNKYYFIQEGVYNNDNIFSNIKNIKEKILEYKNDKIYVYLAITKDIEVAKKISDLYSEKNIEVTIKEKYFNNEEFKNNIEQFDLLTKSAKSSDEILKIQEVVIANYREIVKNKESI